MEMPYVYLLFSSTLWDTFAVALSQKSATAPIRLNRELQWFSLKALEWVQMSCFLFGKTDTAASTTQCKNNYLFMRFNSTGTNICIFIGLIERGNVKHFLLMLKMLCDIYFSWQRHITQNKVIYREQKLNIDLGCWRRLLTNLWAKKQNSWQNNGIKFK